MCCAGAVRVLCGSARVPCSVLACVCGCVPAPAAQSCAASLLRVARVRRPAAASLRPVLPVLLLEASAVMQPSATLPPAAVAASPPPGPDAARPPRLCAHPRAAEAEAEVRCVLTACCAGAVAAAASLLLLCAASSPRSAAVPAVPGRQLTAPLPTAATHAAAAADAQARARRITGCAPRSQARVQCAAAAAAGVGVCSAGVCSALAWPRAVLQLLLQCCAQCPTRPRRPSASRVLCASTARPGVTSPAAVPHRRIRIPGRPAPCHPAWRSPTRLPAWLLSAAPVLCPLLLLVPPLLPGPHRSLCPHRPCPRCVPAACAT